MPRRPSQSPLFEKEKRRSSTSAHRSTSARGSKASGSVTSRQKCRPPSRGRSLTRKGDEKRTSSSAPPAQSAVNTDVEPRGKVAESWNELARLRSKMEAYAAEVKKLSVENTRLGREAKGVLAIRQDYAEAMKKTSAADSRAATLKEKYKRCKECNVGALASIKDLTVQVNEGHKAKTRLIAVTASLDKAAVGKKGVDKALRDERKIRESKETTIEGLQAQIRTFDAKLQEAKDAASTGIGKSQKSAEKHCRECDVKAKIPL